MSATTKKKQQLLEYPVEIRMIKACELETYLGGAHPQDDLTKLQRNLTIYAKQQREDIVEQYETHTSMCLALMR